MPEVDQQRESIPARLRDVAATLPRGEHSVARALSSDYPIAGLGTLAELAARAGVSAPTVLRLLSRIGFDGFTEFQRALHVELSQRLAAVYEDYDQDAYDERGIGAASLAQAAAAVEATATALADDEFSSAVRLLADPRLSVYALGGAFSQSLALLLTTHLGVLRPRVRYLPYGSAEALGALAQAGSRDVLVVYDFRRYSDSVLAVSRHAERRGAQIVLVTDRWLSPVATFADSVLVARTESVSPFDSLAPATALTEALLAGVSALLDETGRERAQAIEKLTAAAAEASGREVPAVGRRREGP
jgi:DNA-binding MurR/RpiR family transcriptional regulator